MNVLVLIREPYLDKVPSLKTLLWYLSQTGYQLLVISSTESKYPKPSFNNDNIKFLYVKKRSEKFELPTTFKLGLEFIKNYIKKKPTYCIGGNTYGNLLLSKFNKLFRFKHIFFLLEYPQIITARHYRLLKRDLQERNTLKMLFWLLLMMTFIKNSLLRR